MTPEQKTIVMQIGHIHDQIYELSRQAEQLRKALLPQEKPRKPIKDWGEFLGMAPSKRRGSKNAPSS
jgi:uncharacterized protein YmfQ (DUF2313 family)